MKVRTVVVWQVFAVIHLSSCSANITPTPRLGNTDGSQDGAVDHLSGMTHSHFVRRAADMS
jgi:hypothetical protein